MLKGLQFQPALSAERIRELHGESLLAGKDGIARRKAVELTADVVNYEKIAIRTVIVTEPEVQADRIPLKRVHLCQGGSC